LNAVFDREWDIDVCVELGGIKGRHFAVFDYSGGPEGKFWSGRLGHFREQAALLYPVRECLTSSMYTMDRFRVQRGKHSARSFPVTSFPCAGAAAQPLWI